jgi:hypothetical protein
VNVKSRFRVSAVVLGTVAIGLWVHAEDQPAKTPSVTLTVEAMPNGKLRITQSMPGKKPTILSVEHQDARFQLRFDQSTKVVADEFRIDFHDGDTVYLSAKGDAELTLPDGRNMRSEQQLEMHFVPSVKK